MVSRKSIHFQSSEHASSGEHERASQIVGTTKEVVSQNLERSMRRDLSCNRKIYAGAAAGASRYDGRVVELLPKRQRLGPSMLQHPPDQIRLRTGKRPLVSDRYGYMPHAESA